MKILVAYHFFPHYRKPVFEALSKTCQGEFNVFYCGDQSSDGIDSSIKAWIPSEGFIYSKIQKIYKKFYFQAKMFTECLFGGYHTVILLSDMNNLATWLLGFLMRFSKTRLLFWGHGWIDKNEKGLKKNIRNFYFSLADGILLYGRRARSIAINNGINGNKIWVIYNSLDANKQIEQAANVDRQGVLALKKEFFGGENIKIVSCISRLTKVRRLDMLIDALSIMKSRGMECGLLLVGDGVEKSNLEAKASLLGVRLHCSGAVYEEEEIAKYLIMSDLAVAPGKVGLTAMHSLAYGVPVITHGDMNNQMPESEAIIKGVTGDFFKFNDVNDLAESIEKWFKSENEDLRNQRSKACQGMIKKFYNPASQVSLILDAIHDRNHQIDISDIILESELDA